MRFALVVAFCLIFGGCAPRGWDARRDAGRDRPIPPDSHLSHQERDLLANDTGHTLTEWLRD